MPIHPDPYNDHTHPRYRGTLGDLLCRQFAQASINKDYTGGQLPRNILGPYPLLLPLPKNDPVRMSEDMLYFWALNQKLPPLEMIDGMLEAVKASGAAPAKLRDLQSQADSLRMHGAASHALSSVTGTASWVKNPVDTFIRSAVHALPEPEFGGSDRRYAQMAEQLTKVERTLSNGSKIPFVFSPSELTLSENNIVGLELNTTYLLPQQMEGLLTLMKQGKILSFYTDKQPFWDAYQEVKERLEVSMRSAIGRNPGSLGIGASKEGE